MSAGLEKRPSSNLYSGAHPDKVAADIDHLVDFQSEGMALEALQEMITLYLVPHLMRYDLPGFQSMFNAFPSPEAAYGAQVALQFNQGVTNWQVSPGGAVLEDQCGQALCRLFNLSPEADATFMYSGTYANQQALYMALHRYAERQGFNLAQEGLAGFSNLSKLVVLVSQDAHFSLKHAVRILGLGDQSLVSIPVDGNRRMDVNVLRSMAAEMVGEKEVFCVVATAGTTSTGAVDPISAIADVCKEIDAWLHVDGAYGYAYKLVPEWAELFAGDHRADSIVWDPHKQLGAPIPNSVLFVKDQNEFARMALHSSYFNRADDAVPNPGIKSPPSTRPMSALPLTAILRGQGTAVVIENLRQPLTAVHNLWEFLKAQPDFEVLHKPDTGVLCFRITPAGVPVSKLDALQQDIYRRVLFSGSRSISITTIDEKVVLRVVVVNHDVVFEDLLETIGAVRLFAGNFKG